MSVYVDRARIPYRGMLMSHMVADTVAELRTMADAIGVARKHFQVTRRAPHYDICWGKREKALKLGAIPISRHELVHFIRRLRAIHGVPTSIPTVVHTFPAVEPVVGMVIVKEQVIIATARSVYRLMGVPDDMRVEPLPLVKG